MNKTRKAMLLLTAALTALLFGVVGIGQAGAAAGPAAAPADRLLADPGDVVRCEGKAQLQAIVLTKSSPETIGENAAFVPVTGASINVPGPASAADTDQLIVTFTGEAALNGQPNVLNPVVDAMMVRVLVNGVALPPGAVAFTTDAGQSDALQACTVVTGPGPHVVTVEWRLFDFANNSMLNGTLSSWELHVERND
ncbi:MAG: hypothetical protein SYR96_29080 [Actinomycetota bacterium]|nr:hypothetical protein [Actinomycetota bacterium]